MSRTYRPYGFMVGATTTEAAPPFAIFEGWVPRTMVSELSDNTLALMRTHGGGGDEWTDRTESRCSHLSKTAKGGAAPVIIVPTETKAGPSTKCGPPVPD